MYFNSDLSSLSFQELGALMIKIQEEQNERQKKIPIDYGPWFCKIVGQETICRLPEMDAKSLGLDRDGKYPEGTTPSMLRTHSAVRGIMSWNRPFIAIKVEVREIDTDKIVGVFVEVIFKRYGLDGEGAPGRARENHYVTLFLTHSDDGKKHGTFLYGAGAMKEEGVIAVRDLLEGQEVVSPIYKNSYKLRMVS